MTRIISISFVVVAFFTQTAQAEESEVYLASTELSTSPQRTGFTAGMSIGRGSIDIDCSSCSGAPRITEALSMTAHAGYMLTSRLALLGEHWTVRYNDRGSEWFDDSSPHLIAQRIFAIAGQAFITDRLWLKAGFGVGWHISDSEYTRGTTPYRSEGPVAAADVGGKNGPITPMDPAEKRGASPAYFVATGFEFAHNHVFAADIQLRIGATRRPKVEYQIYNTAVNIGFNWY